MKAVMSEEQVDELVRIMRSDDAPALRAMLAAGGDINAIGKYERTALHWAVYFGAQHCMRSLLEAGADLTLKDDNGDTPLALAQWREDEAGLCMLRQAGQKDISPIMQAVWRGDVAALQVLISGNAAQEAVNEADAFGYSPLHVAVLPGCTACLPLLLSAGAEPDALSGAGWTPLMLATSLADIPTMKALVEAGASPDVTKDETPLIMAITRRKAEMVKFLLAAGADVNKGDAGNRTPLHHAVCQPEMMQLLLHAGADPNIADNVGSTPLAECASRDLKNVIPCMRMLIDAGADVNDNRGRFGRTPLFWASSSRTAPQLVQILLDAGADPNLAGSDGYSALHLAARYSNAEGVRLLLAAGADAAARDSEGNFPHNEASGRDGRECRELLQAALRARGIELPRKTRPLTTPADICRRLRRKAIILRSSVVEGSVEEPVSRLGRVTRQRPGEEWPTDARGNRLEPLATIFVPALPHLPAALRKLALITIFAPRHAWVRCAGGDYRLGFVVRSYASVEGLEVCDYAASGLVPCILTPEPVINDMPLWQACGGSEELWKQIEAIEAAQEVEYRESILEVEYATHKIGGYPTYTQEAPSQPAGYSFVLHLCSDETAELRIGDCGNYYFYYNPRKDDWRVYADFC